MAAHPVTEQEAIEAVEAYRLSGGNKKAAAHGLGLPESTYRNRLSVACRLYKLSPDKETDLAKVQDGQKLKGVSTLYGPDGEIKAQWVKSETDKQRMEEIMRELVTVMASKVSSLSKKIEKPKQTLKDILVVYPFGDPHVGLHCWAKECGEAFDLEIGRKLTLGAVDRLISSVPSAETAILLLLGDVFHMNDQTNQTPAHKHQLDVDTRFVKVLQVGIETYRHAIYRSLEKHKKVIVKCIPGNHDPQAIWALAFTLSAYFSNEKRVEVDLGPSKFWFYRFGKVLIGSTHGDTVKPDSLAAVMACDRPEDWGQTKYRYFYTGHIHSSNKKEYPGMVWESFRTLAAQDSYAAGHGYRAGRDMLAIVHHKEFGEIERHRCDVAMLD